MRISLAVKLYGLVIVLVVFVVLAMGWFAIRHETEALGQEFDKRAQLIQRNLAYNSRLGIIANDRDGLYRLLQGVVREDDIDYAVVMDHAKEPLARAGEAVSQSIRTYYGPVLILVNSVETERLSLLGVTDFIGDYSGEQTEIIGYIELGGSLDGLHRQAAEVKKVVALVMVDSMVIALLFAYLILRYLIQRPLQQLFDGIKITSQGDLDHKIKITSRDELGEVAKLYNQMTGELSQTLVSKDFFDCIFQSMMNGLIVVGMGGRVQTANQAALAQLGYAEEELCGMPMEQIFAESSRLNPSVDELLGQERVRNIEKRYLSKDGRVIPMLLSSSFLRDLDGKVSAYIFVSQDISELKKVEEEAHAYMKLLESSNRELEEFAFVASHDLQEPLRKVATFGDRLQARCGDALDSRGRDYLDRMQKAASRMHSLINGLLTYSRVSTQAGEFESVDLNVAVAEVLSDLEIRIEQSGGRVEVSPLPVIAADPIQIRQLLQNLISNALKFHEGEPPLVTVSCNYSQVGDDPLPDMESGEEFVRISIQDNGIGFDQKYADRIFRVFQRLHGRSSIFEGTGIGLSVCHGIIEDHDGTIIAKNAPDAGAVFTAKLPTT